MLIEEAEDNDLRVKPSKQNIDGELGVPEPFINKPAVYAVIGAMGSGKSCFMNSIMTATGKGKVFKRKFDYVFYSTPKECYESEGTNHPFSKHNPARLFHDLSQTTFDKITEHLENAKEKEQNSCLLLDDWSELYKNKAVLANLQRLIYKHRHFRLNIIITALNLKSIPRQLRALIDVYVIFRPKSVVAVRDFVDDVLGMSRQDAKVLFDYIYDTPYNFMFFNQRSHTFYKNFNKLTIKEE
jgi:hypothetical protein